MTRLACLALATALLACGDDAANPDAGPIDARAPGSTFTVSWTVNEDGGGALSCEDVAATSVVVTGVPIDGVVGFSEVFTCATGEGTSGEVNPGRYNLLVDLRTTGGTSLLDAPVALNNVEIVGAAPVAAGQAVFTVVPTGSLTFALDAETDGPNCDDFDAGGGGIVGFRFEVSDATGCLDGVAIAVGDGGGFTGTYTTDCTTPPVVGCIENDQTLTIGPRRSGAYTLSIVGQKQGAVDPIDCYTRSTAANIPGHELTAELGALNLGLAENVDCDPSLLPDAGAL